MKNVIRSNGIVRKRRSKKLVSGDIQCGICGVWVAVRKFTDKHYNETFNCSSCKKELKVADTPTPIRKPRKIKGNFPDNCPHRNFFGCQKAINCVGCYYNPDWNIAKQTQEDEERKTKKVHWFYGDKKHAKELLEMLEDIRNGRGLMKGGNRYHFKYARTKIDEDEE